MKVMPPGIGDAQLTMAQQVPLKGAVIVSTPQSALSARAGTRNIAAVVVGNATIGIAALWQRFLPS
jgi:Mrp family chromosome partitioning ATPase